MTAWNKTASAKDRAGVSSRRTREKRKVSVGSGVKSALASGKSTGPACTCILTTRPAKPAIKAPTYQTLQEDGRPVAADSEKHTAAHATLPQERLSMTENDTTEVQPVTEVVPPPAPEAELTPRALLGGLAIDDPEALRAELERYSTVRRIFVDWLFSHLVAGTDYILVHRRVGPRGNKQDCPDRANASGTRCEKCGGKSTLAKAGSEKLCGILQLRPRFRRDEDTWQMLGSEPGVVALVCELIGPTGAIVAEGRGARHREMDLGLVNTTIKMAEKSSQVDAVLRCAGLSELFSQDLESGDVPGFSNGDDEPEFPTPRSKRGTDAPPPPPAPVNLEGQLRESVERAREARAATSRPAPVPTRPAPRPTGRAVPRLQAGSATGQTPPDALSPARVQRLFALLHEAVRAAEVPQEEHEGVFNAARAYLTDWVGRTQGRERISDVSYKSYDELCGQVPVAVEAALGGGDEPPAPRPRPRFVRRSYNVPRPFA